LKGVLNLVTDQKQSTILENKGLLESVIVGNEIIDDMRRNNKKCIIFKAYFEKAYDSVNWKYLIYMMGRLGFYDKG